MNEILYVSISLELLLDYFICLYARTYVTNHITKRNTNINMKLIRCIRRHH